MSALAPAEPVPSSGRTAVTVRGEWRSTVDRDAVWAALCTVEDPELPVTVTDLGLVRVLAAEGGEVTVGMTWTSLACPCTEMMRDDIRDRVGAVPGVASVVVADRLAPWSRDDVTPEGRELLRAVAVI